MNIYGKKNSFFLVCGDNLVLFVIINVSSKYHKKYHEQNKNKTTVFFLIPRI